MTSSASGPGPWVVLLAVAQLACGGAARAPEPAAAVTVPAAASASTVSSPSPSPSPSPRATLDTAESAARAFVEGIAKHDVEAVVHASGDEAFARGRVQEYADVTDARVDGPAPLDAWPYLSALDPGAELYWATFGVGQKSERILLSVSRRRLGRWHVIGIRDEATRASAAADADKNEQLEQRARAPLERKGKLLSKPVNGSVRVQLEDDAAPSPGARLELFRRVDPSVPFVGGSWIMIADTEVATVSNRVVTLKVLAQKAVMKINGRPLDHYTPGVPVVLKEPPAAARDGRKSPR